MGIQIPMIDRRLFTHRQRGVARFRLIGIVLVVKIFGKRSEVQLLVYSPVYAAAIFRTMLAVGHLWRWRAGWAENV